jgi:hypothetical protein
MVIFPSFIRNLFAIAAVVALTFYESCCRFSFPEDSFFTNDKSKIFNVERGVIQYTID